MKQIILTILIFFLFFKSGFCQAPTQAEIDKMMKDAKAMLAKYQQQAKDSPSFKKVSKKYVPAQPASSVVLISLKQPLQIPAPAQAKDRLLWYKGKKVNDSTIVTTKGMLVQYQNKRDRVVAQPLEKEDSFRILVKNLSRTAQMTNDYVVKEVAKKNSFMNYPLVKMTVDEFKMIDDRMNDIVKNTIDLPEPGLTVPQKSKGADGESALKAIDLDQMHQQLKQLLANKPSLNFDPPPKRDFSLVFMCDTNARHRYIEELKKWDEAFLRYESELVNKDLQIERSMQLLGVDRDADASLRADLDEGLNVAFSRWDEKLKLLKAQYGKDIFRQECVVTAILRNERTKQLMGRSSADTELDIDFFFGPEFENYINEQIAKKNWDVIMNMSLFLGRERQAQLFGMSEADGKLHELLQRTLDLNRFALTASIDFNIQYTDGEGKLAVKANGKIETTDKVYVSMYVTWSRCKWTLQLYTPDFATAKESDYYIPMTVTGGIKSVKDEKGNWKDYVYSGPKDMQLHFPVFRFDFAGGGEQDSVTVEPARYLPGEDIVAEAEGTYKAGLLGFMNYVFIADLNAAATPKDMMKVANEMMGKFNSVTSMPASDEPLETLRKRYLLMQQKQEAERETAAASFKAKAVILFDATNNTTVLIDQNVDTKHKEEAMELTKGLVKIKVVHDPVE